MEVPGERIAVDSTGCLGPAVDRVLVHSPPLAVLVRHGRVEDQAVGMKLRVVVAAGAVLEHSRHEVGPQHVDLSVTVADAGPGAMAEYRLLQRHARGVVVGPLDLGRAASGSAMAQRAETLLSAEKVMSRPGERLSLPAFRVSLPEPSGAKPW